MPLIDEWIEIKGYPRYVIHRDGRVKDYSPHKITGAGNPIKRDSDGKKYRELKRCIDEKGYPYVYIKTGDKKKQKRFHLHTLLLETFVGPCPSGMECRHLDRDRNNISLTNLKWGTRSQNTIDAINHGTAASLRIRPAFGEENTQSKLTEAQVLEIRRLKKKGVTQKKLAKQFNIGEPTLSDIVRNKTWRHILDPDKLQAIEFGRQLIESKDLDPVYCLLWKAGLGRELLKRWLLAYWMFYHMGTVSWIVDQKNYWRAMREAASSSDYPRATERRHFRGDLAKKSVECLKDLGLVKLFSFGDRYVITLDKVITHVKSWYGCGGWIAFKVADMLDRLKLYKVLPDKAAMFLYSSPQEGTELVAKQYNLTSPAKSVEFLVKSLNQLQAPPRYERPVGVMEVETVLCKYSAYNWGKYFIGKDIAECREALEHFKTPTAHKLLKAGKGVLW